MTGTKSDPTTRLRKIGGAMYPRINLNDAVQYAKKLVSKTHVGPQPYSTIFPGVFGVAPNNTRGEIRASALKQYGLLEGKRDEYSATELAKKIASEVPGEVEKHLQEAVLKPKIFRTLYDTFRGDETSLPKLRQQASSSGVHPERAENCATIFSESAAFAKLRVADGENLILDQALLNEGQESIAESRADENTEESEDEDASGKGKLKPENNIVVEESPKSARSVIQVNVTIDSSLDTEKLERQLAILRKYGAI